MPQGGEIGFLVLYKKKVRERLREAERDSEREAERGREKAFIKGGKDVRLLSSAGGVVGTSKVKRSSSTPKGMWRPLFRSNSTTFDTLPSEIAFFGQKVL